MKQGSNDTFLVSKDFLTGPWRHTKALSALSGTFFFFFLTLKPLVKLLFFQILFPCKFIVYFSIRNCSYVGIYQLFFMIVIMSNAVPSPWREVVPLSGDCVDTYSTSVLFVCILGF